MRQAAALRTTYFIDIPATGDSSVRSGLEVAFTADERVFLYEQSSQPEMLSIERFTALPRDRRERLSLVMGSFVYGLHRQSRTPHAYVTLVRDPLARILSLYQRFLDLASLRQRATDERWRPGTDATTMSLEDFVFGQQHLAVDNGMVRAVAGRQHVRFGQCPDDLLDEAIRHVEQEFTVVLVAEDQATSVRALEAALGRVVPITFGAMEDDRPAAALDPRVRDRIGRLNGLDYALYEFARSRLSHMGLRSS
jgi:hypothetical protein